MQSNDYRTETSDKQLELLARLLMPEIKKFFADEKIKNEFERWMAQRKKDIKKDNK